MSSMESFHDHYKYLIANARNSREAEEIFREYRRNMEYYDRYHDKYENQYNGSPYGAGLRPQPISSAPPSTVEVKPSKLLDEEQLVSAIIGYRAWNVPLFVDELRSVAKSTKWKPYQRFNAACELSQCSGVSCQCGIYAFNKAELVQQEYRQSDRSKRYVYGECWLWGRVLECKDGYRAQFAYPKSFVNNGAIAKRMAEIFGIELTDK